MSHKTTINVDECLNPHLIIIRVVEWDARIPLPDEKRLRYFRTTLPPKKILSAFFHHMMQLQQC